MDFEAKLNNNGKKFMAIDSHTMGEPTRIILSGFPELEGNTMMEKKKFMEENYDHYRTALLLEPRGHRDMFGAVLTKPISEEADLGVIFMESGGYLNMCGHGSIGTATVAVEAGLVEVTEPYTTVVLEAPAGIIRTNVKVNNGKAEEVSILNVPSFLYKEDLVIDLKDYGMIPVDISFGGSFFALVDSEKIGISITQNNLKKLIDFGMKLMDKINKTMEIKHPYLDITTVDLVEIYGKADNPKADMKNVVIFGESQADRSPCGTGTSAKIAYLYGKGELKLGEEFVYESITGSLFRGEATNEITIEGRKAIVPKITGSAYITGINNLIIDEDDPLAYGFLMGRKHEKAANTEKKDIITTAWELFRVKGYNDVELSEIVEKCDMDEEDFYKFFSSKEELLYTLSYLFDERYAELMVEIDPLLSAYEKLLILNKELFTMIEDKIPMDLLGYLYSSQMIDHGDKHLLDQERLYYKLVGQIMQEGQSAGDFITDNTAEELVEAYAMLERGLLYDWCIGQKQKSLTKISNKLMPDLLAGLLGLHIEK